jgi:nitrile hydratase
MQTPAHAVRSCLAGRGAQYCAMATAHFKQTAPVEARVKAVESVLRDRGFDADETLSQLDHAAQEEWVPQNGARVVARAWSDPAFRARLLDNGIAAIGELGLPMPKHHRHLVVLENTAKVHNVICCTLCSCTAFTLVGLPPDWYKDFEYRSRVVRESRTVLAEMGLELPSDTEVRVWDTTTDTRYMVLPEQPAHSVGWPEDQLARLVTRDSLIGVSRL